MPGGMKMTKFVHCTVVESRPIKQPHSRCSAPPKSSPKPYHTPYDYVKHAYHKQNKSVFDVLPTMDFRA